MTDNRLTVGKSNKIIFHLFIQDIFWYCNAPFTRTEKQYDDRSCSVSFSDNVFLSETGGDEAMRLAFYLYTINSC